MAPKVLPTGAYIIRNKKNNKVIHITQANIAATTEPGKIELKDRDENTYPEQQIWWVERIPEYEHLDDPIYAITNPASGKYLSVSEDRKHTSVSQSNGRISQKWKLLEPSSEHLEEGRAYYNIIDLEGDYSLDGANDPTFIYNSDINDMDQCWEFIEPDTKYPSGWFEITNSGTGNLLNHTYLTSPPRLIYPPEKNKEFKLPMYRERWGTQWTISRYAANCPETITESGDTSWIIKNRLTGGRLSLDGSLDVVAGQYNGPIDDQERWILNFRSNETAWMIRNKENSCYLEQVGEDMATNGIKVVCNEKNCMRWPMDKHKRWCFRPVGDHV